MDSSALTAGIEPGGLRDKKEIKLLICYMLSSVQSGLSKNDIISVMQNNGLANYFEIADAFSDLLQSGNIVLMPEDDSLYTVTPTGRMISKQLDISLPISVRERALSATLNLLAREKCERENSVNIQKTDNGYTVTCHSSGGEMDLMSFSLYVPDKLQAKLVKKNFHSDPERVYRCMLALVTGNWDMVRDVLKQPEPENILE